MHFTTTTILHHHELPESVNCRDPPLAVARALAGDRIHDRRRVRICDHGCANEALVGALRYLSGVVPALRFIAPLLAADYSLATLLGSYTSAQSLAASRSLRARCHHVEQFRVRGAPPESGAGLFGFPGGTAAHDRVVRTPAARKGIRPALAGHSRGLGRRLTDLATVGQGIGVRIAGGSVRGCARDDLLFPERIDGALVGAHEFEPLHGVLVFDAGG